MTSYGNIVNCVLRVGSAILDDDTWGGKVSFELVNN